MVMGVLLAMPFGPVNLLGIQRAVERGFFGGMAAGLGIMVGDGLIALGAALGVNAISGAIREYRTAIQIIGGLALLGAGIKLYLTPADRRHRDAGREGDAARLHLGHSADVLPHHHQSRRGAGADRHLRRRQLVRGGGVLHRCLHDGGGHHGRQLLYWFVVSQFIATIRHRLDVVRLGQINRIAGLVLIGFGCVLIGEMVVKRLRFW